MATIADLSTVPLMIIDDLGMRQLPRTAAEDLPELIMRRYERASTILTLNRTVDDWGKLLGATAAITALLDRVLQHAHVLTCGPRSWRTKLHTGPERTDPPYSPLTNLSAPAWWPVLRCRSMAGFELSTEHARAVKANAYVHRRGRQNEASLSPQDVLRSRV